MDKTIIELKSERQALLEELEGIVSKSEQTDEDVERKDAIKAEVKRINEVLEVKEELKDAEFTAENPTEHKTVDEMEAFRSFLLNGEAGMTVEERQVIQTSLGSANIPKTVAADILAKIAEKSPVKNVSKVVMTADAGSYVYPLDTDSETGELLPDGTTASTGDTSYSSVTLDAYQYSSKIVRVTRKALASSTFGLEDQIANALINRVAKKLNVDGTSGDGSSKMEGVEHAATAISATGISVANLNSLFFAVDAGYRMNPSCYWMMPDSALASVAALTYDEQRALGYVEDGGRFFIKGKEVVVNNALSSILFGDFNYFIWRDVQDMTIRRLTDGDAGKANAIDFVLFTFNDSALADPGDHPIQKLALS